MGSLCGCESQLISQPSTGIQINSPQLDYRYCQQDQKQHGKKRFQDIVPRIKIEQEQLSQRRQPRLLSVKSSRRNNQGPFFQSTLIFNNINNISIEQAQKSLWKLNNQLSTLVCTFQQQNGELTKTFLQQQKSLRKTLQKPNQEIDNVSVIVKSNDSAQKQNQAMKIVQKKALNKKKLVNQNKQQRKTSVKQRSAKLLSGQNLRINTKESRKSCQSQNKQKLKQILQRQINLTQDKVQSNSQPSQNQLQQQFVQQSNFIQRTKFLDSSLKSERIRQIADFFKESSVINGRQTQQWGDQHRKGLKLILSNFKEIPQICNSLKLSKNVEYLNALNLTLTILGAIKTYDLNHQIKLISYHQTQQQAISFRIFVNGTKRMIKVGKGENIEFSLFTLLCGFFMQDFTNNEECKKINTYESPLFCIYYLTGWIPQSIHLKQIGEIDGILERINSNFVQGHTIISFSQYQTRNSIQHSKHLYLVRILLQEEILQVNNGIQWLEQNSIGSGNFYIQWSDILQNYDVINVNWSPCIYQHIYSMNGLVKLDSFRTTVRSEFPQYHLKIPSSKQDIEVRLFLQIHTKFLPIIGDAVSFAIQLYDYHGFMAHNSGDSIRSSFSMNQSKQLHSDVFIFQASEQKTEYLLVLVPQFNQKRQTEQVLFTFTVNSFNALSFKQVKKKNALYTITQSAFISPINQGYSINSPSFLNNLQFNLQVPPMSHLRLTIESQLQHIYDINIISDPQNCKDIAKLNLQNLLSDNYRSCQIQGDGCCQFISKYDSYILVIAGYSKYKGQIKIILQFLSDITLNRISKLSEQISAISQSTNKNLNNEKQVNSQFLTNQEIQNRQSIAESAIISIKQIVFNPKIVYEKKINWNSINPGPRKRTKSNSTSAYHPYTTFEQFFRNPFIDKQIQAGIYQFNIISKTYQQMFNNTTDQQTKLALQPPTLSLAIMKVSSNDKNFKIINDDAFYVPFGIGYWSQQMTLQQGKYRFIFPKIEKEKSVGLFRIRQK